MHLRWAGLSWLHLILILETDSSSSSHLWKLNREAGLIQSSILQPLSFQAEEILHDPLFSIILSTHHEGSAWVKKSSNFCTNCKRLNSTFSLDDDVKDVLVRRAGQSEDSKEGGTAKGEALGDENISGRKEGGSKLPPPTLPPEEDDEPLDCGKPVNFTYYDNLVGISNRLSHPNVPEPQISLIFKNKKSSEIDVGAVERKLKKAKREKPKSVQLYNQIGNFWRLKGDTYKSIECFRRALAVSPHNAEVLLNLARVLFTLQYLDDAIYLTRRSLEVQPPDKSAWQQYFTLGEIFKAYGHYQEASLHMRHCLQLRPAFEPALTALKEMETTPDNNIHVYTLLIIVCLVLGVLLVIISSLDSTLETDSAAGDGKARHFNKAMAMRSLKMGISPRSSAIRSRHRHSNHSG